MMARKTHTILVIEDDPAGAECRLPDGSNRSFTSAEEDFDLCNECGGLCCALFLAHDEEGAYIGEGWLPEYIALWEQRLVESGALRVTASAYLPGEAGVMPLHDPRVSHLPTAEGEAYRAAMAAGVDYRKCVFCDAENGCLLPRDYRAPICREYVCELWGRRT